MGCLYSPCWGSTAVGEETFHPPSLGALIARLQCGMLNCASILLAPGALIIFFVHAGPFLLFLSTLGNSLLCWPATVCLKHLSASRQFMGNLKSREREAGNPARALPLCAQLNDSKIPRLRFVPFKMLYLEKLDRANVVPLKPYNRQ